jgi:antitoxin HicB
MSLINEGDYMTNKHKGTSFENFLEENALYEHSEAIAIKRVVAFQLSKLMKKEHINKSEMAAKLHTSRSALDRLLDPSNTSVTLITLIKVAHILGKKLRVYLYG